MLLPGAVRVRVRLPRDILADERLVQNQEERQQVLAPDPLGPEALVEHRRVAAEGAEPLAGDVEGLGARDTEDLELLRLDIP